MQGILCENLGVEEVEADINTRVIENTNLLEKKYVQFLSAGEHRDYEFSFRPC